MTKRHDVRRVREHLTYSIPEICSLFGINPGTVSAWIKQGLPRVDDKRPYIFTGRHLAAFVAAKNKCRQPLKPGEIYCVACKAPRWPANNRARFIQLSATNGDLIGTCPVCGRSIYRRTRIEEINVKAGSLTLEYEDETVPVN